ncbi:hypothetical protein GN244_ATG03451 [Phytophthora infestans]|uniref:Uncharacterized protein n=2 Tax=Phytophthora infestans TaxID=4787 RepID=A0A833T147_PHYIN|nr:hypothetical protein GN244_ATG03451 [Phytophthora infestans]
MSPRSRPWQQRLVLKVHVNASRRMLMMLDLEIIVAGMVAKDSQVVKMSDEDEASSKVGREDKTNVNDVVAKFNTGGNNDQTPKLCQRFGMVTLDGGGMSWENTAAQKTGTDEKETPFIHLMVEVLAKVNDVEDARAQHAAEHAEKQLSGELVRQTA